MSSVDELCAMLADRREEFFVNDFGVNWRYYSDPHTATESMDGTLIVTGLTPEQAIAATLGPGTCYEVKIDRHYRGCSECGYRWEYMYAVGWQIGPNFCPNCGRRIEVEE